MSIRYANTRSEAMRRDARMGVVFYAVCTVTCLAICASATPSSPLMNKSSRPLTDMELARSIGWGVGACCDGTVDDTQSCNLGSATCTAGCQNCSFQDPDYSGNSFDVCWGYRGVLRCWAIGDTDCTRMAYCAQVHHTWSYCDVNNSCSWVPWGPGATCDECTGAISGYSSWRKKPVEECGN